MIVNGLPRFETCHDERLKIVFNWNDAEKRTVLFCLATCAHDGIVSGRCPFFPMGIGLSLISLAHKSVNRSDESRDLMSRAL